MMAILNGDLQSQVWKAMIKADTTLIHRIKTELVCFWGRNDARKRRRARRKRKR